MTPNRIEDHIDRKIIKSISEGKDFDCVMDNLKDSISRFSARKGFIEVKKSYLIRNWNYIPIKKKYTTFYVMYSNKRLQDIKWAVKNKDNFNYSDETMFNLLMLRDKLKTTDKISNTLL